MDADQLLEVTCYAGKLLIESGAEVYRVEETMVRLSTSFPEVEDAQSFVTTTGIMFSITVNKKTQTKILRVHTRGVDLNCIDKINHLSREAARRHFSIEELYERLHEIEQEKRYSICMIILFGALSAGGFAIFFHGTLMEACFSFFIGICIKIVSILLEKRGVHGFFTNAIAAAVSAICALFFHSLCKTANTDIMIISSIMLLVPGLAITNAIRDTVAGDYLSGVARATEAFLVAIAIAAGIGFILSLSIGISGGM